MCESGFPALQSKAIASKTISIWLASKAISFADRPEATEADRMMCTCIVAYTEMIKLMEASPLIMSEEQASNFKRLTLRHLRSYVWLHKNGLNCERTTPGKKCFLLLPKLHHLWHLGFDTEKYQLNPRASQLLSAESFIGFMGRVGRACHRSTVSKRSLERYLCKLYSSVSCIKR